MPPTRLTGEDGRLNAFPDQPQSPIFWNATYETTVRYSRDEGCTSRRSDGSANGLLSPEIRRSKHRYRHPILRTTLKSHIPRIAPTYTSTSGRKPLPRAENRATASETREESGKECAEFSALRKSEVNRRRCNSLRWKAEVCRACHENSPSGRVPTGCGSSNGWRLRSLLTSLRRRRVPILQGALRPSRVRSRVASVRRLP